jgi:signal transduction histidine kinase
LKSGKAWPPHSDWSYDRQYHGWPAHWQRKRRFLFLRLATLFGFVALLFLGGLAAAAFLLTRLLGGDGQTALLVWVLGCGLAMALPLLAVFLAIRAFRSVATPLASVMAAADAVAEGDLSVRLPESGSGEFRQLAQSFNRMTQELERAEQRRRNLTADVAHELRTPLHIIQGNLEGILDGVYEPTEAHIEAMLEETHLLSRLVDDLRTLSLAEAGQLELVLEPVDVAELLADVLTSFSGQADAAGIALDLSTNGDSEPMIVSADVGRLDQVLGNLMVNALRHTPPGGIVRLVAVPRPGGVRISVIDTGEGIPPEQLPYIFDRFWRGDRSRSHVEGSLGLGLAIAQQLVHAQGGQIQVESKPAEGTSFIIDLPADAGAS